MTIQFDFLSWKAKCLENNFLISEAWAERDLLHSTSLSWALDRPRLYLPLPCRNQKIYFAQRTFYDSRLLLYHSTVETVGDSRINSRMNVIINNRVVVTITCTVRVCIVKSKILNLHDVVMNGQILIFLQIYFHHLNHFLNFLYAKDFSLKSSLWSPDSGPGNFSKCSPLWCCQNCDRSCLAEVSDQNFFVLGKLLCWHSVSFIKNENCIFSKVSTSSTPFPRE